MRIVVIGDLHMSAELLDDCDTELEAAVVEFLDRFSLGMIPRKDQWKEGRRS
jgi:hypothetical protein